MMTAFSIPECAADHLPSGFARRVRRASALAERVSRLHGARHTHLSAVTSRLAKVAALLGKLDDEHRLSPACSAALERLLAEAMSKVA